MPKPKPPISGPAVAAGIGAGVAAALFSMLVAQKTSFALAMGFISPLPIMIAAMGFGSLSGLIAVVIGTAAAGLFDMRPGGLVLVLPNEVSAAGLDVLVFALSLGLPSWFLARLAIMPVPKVETASPPQDGGRPQDNELGNIVAAAVGFAAIGVALDFVIAVTKQGGFSAFMAETVAKTEPLVRTLLASNRPLPKSLTAHDIALAVTWGQIPLMAGAGVILLVFNLWLAARIAQASGLLARSWPDISRHLRLPRPLALALAFALGLSFAGGLVGMMSLVASGAILMGFVLQGLAVIHAVTRGKSFRLPLLIIVYLSMTLLMPWLLLLYGLLGLLDSGFAFRDRRKKPVPPPGPWHPPPPSQNS